MPGWDLTGLRGTNATHYAYVCNPSPWAAANAIAVVCRYLIVAATRAQPKGISLGWRIEIVTSWVMFR